MSSKAEQPKNLGRVGFGGAAVSGEGGGYGFGEISEDESLRLIRYAYECGIKLFDTAPVYGFGMSETRIGKALKPIRDQVSIVSKSGVSWHEGVGKRNRVNMSNDPKLTAVMLDQSLRRLDSDYIDYYLVHWPDPKVDIRYTLEPLIRAQEVGKVRWLGLSNTYWSDLQLASEVAKIDMLHFPRNFFTSGLDSEIVQWLEGKNVSVTTYGTFDKGILSGRVNCDRKYDDSDARSWAPWWKKSPVDAKIEIVEQLLERKLVENFEELRVACLAFAREYEISGTPLVGTRNCEQVDDAIELSQREISKDHLIKIYQFLCSRLSERLRES